MRKGSFNEIKCEERNESSTLAYQTKGFDKIKPHRGLLAKSCL